MSQKVIQKTSCISLPKSILNISSIQDCPNVVVSIQDELAGVAVTTGSSLSHMVRRGISKGYTPLHAESCPFVAIVRHSSICPCVFQQTNFSGYGNGQMMFPVVRY